MSTLLFDEMHQIRAYVEATNTRIHYLEDFLEPCAKDQIASIKRGLRDVHRGLERLGKTCRLKGVDEITKDVWRSYRKMRVVEEKVKQHGNGMVERIDEKLSSEELSNIKAIEVVAIKHPPLNLGEFVPWTNEDLNDSHQICPEGGNGNSDRIHDLSAKRCIVARALPVLRGQEPVSRHCAPPQGQLEHNSQTSNDSIRDDELQGNLCQTEKQEIGALNVEIHPVRNTMSAPEEDESAQFTNGTIDCGHLALPMVRQPRSSVPPIPSKASKITNGVFVPKGVHPPEIAIAEGYGSNWDCQSSYAPTKASREVRYSIIEEEDVDTVGLHDAEKRREGSENGRKITTMIMSGIKDKALFLPHLLYIKVHEVRALKGWLVGQRYLHRTAGIGRSEKILHLLTLLQMGCRIESVAVFFSRTPKEVQDSCFEVFEGLLEMHSETMLPGPNCDRWLAYEHCWNITKKYEHYGGQEYFKWSLVSILDVLVTLNIFIGRYRRYGELRLIGEILPWGEYVRPKPVPG